MYRQNSIYDTNNFLQIKKRLNHNYIFKKNLQNVDFYSIYNKYNIYNKNLKNRKCENIHFLFYSKCNIILYEQYKLKYIICCIIFRLLIYDFINL